MQMSDQIIGPKAAPQSLPLALQPVASATPDQPAPAGDFTAMLRRVTPSNATQTAAASASVSPASGAVTPGTLLPQPLLPETGLPNMVSPSSASPNSVSLNSVLPGTVPLGAALSGPMPEAAPSAAQGDALPAARQAPVLASLALPAADGALKAKPVLQSGSNSSSASSSAKPQDAPSPTASQAATRSSTEAGSRAKPDRANPNLPLPTAVVAYPASVVTVQAGKPEIPRAEAAKATKATSKAKKSDAMAMPSAAPASSAANQAITAPINMPLPANPVTLALPSAVFGNSISGSSISGNSVSGGMGVSSLPAGPADRNPRIVYRDNAALAASTASPASEKPFDSAMAAQTKAAQAKAAEPATAVASPDTASANAAAANFAAGLPVAQAAGSVPVIAARPDAAASSATAPASPAALSSAAHQAAAAMVSIGAGPDPGTQRLTIAMTPSALGHVTIRIDRLPDGSAAIAVSATHAATLAALHGDRPMLEQALTQAGVPLQHRSLEFRLESFPAAGGAGFMAQNGATNGNASGQGRQPSSRGTFFANPVPVAGPELTLPVMRRFGINFTA